MLRLKEKNNLLINHLGIFAVFRLIGKSFKIEFVSEGYSLLLTKGNHHEAVKWKNKSLQHIIKKDFINYVSLEQLTNSFNTVIRNKFVDVLESGKDLEISALEFEYGGEDLQEGFDIINTYFPTENEDMHYILHRLVPKNHTKAQKIQKEKREILKQLQYKEYFKRKYFDNSEKALALVNVEGLLIEGNKSFYDQFIEEDYSGKINITRLVADKEQRLMLMKALQELIYYRDSKMKLNFIPDIRCEISLSLILRSRLQPLIFISFEESSYISKLEKKSTEKGYMMETIGILLKLFNKSFEPKKLLNDGIQYVNAIIGPDITQTYIYEAKNNAFNLILEHSSGEYLGRITKKNHLFNDLVDIIVETLNPKKPKLIHFDTIKNTAIKTSLDEASLKSVLIIPTIKMENIVSLTVFGFMDKMASIDLEKIGHYTSIVDLLLHEVYHRMDVEEIVLGKKIK